MDSTPKPRKIFMDTADKTPELPNRGAWNATQSEPSPQRKYLRQLYHILPEKYPSIEELYSYHPEKNWVKFNKSYCIPLTPDGEKPLQRSLPYDNNRNEAKNLDFVKTAGIDYIYSDDDLTQIHDEELGRCSAEIAIFPVENLRNIQFNDGTPINETPKSPVVLRAHNENFGYLSETENCHYTVDAESLPTYDVDSNTEEADYIADKDIEKRRRSSRRNSEKEEKRILSLASLKENRDKKRKSNSHFNSVYAQIDIRNTFRPIGREEYLKKTLKRSDRDIRNFLQPVNIKEPEVIELSDDDVIFESSAANMHGNLNAEHYQELLKTKNNDQEINVFQTDDERRERSVQLFEEDSPHSSPLNLCNILEQRDNPALAGYFNQFPTENKSKKSLSPSASSKSTRKRTFKRGALGKGYRAKSNAQKNHNRKSYAQPLKTSRFGNR